jgi:uncharacterized membrane protein YgaE (UPF0421/DUF939 family)
MADKINISFDTKIEFTIKTFLTTVGTILTIFASFYFMVIDPRIDRAEVNAEKLLEIKTENINNQLIDIKGLIEKDHEVFRNGIKAALDASTANTHRFKDINDVANSSPNRGGSSTSNR